MAHCGLPSEHSLKSSEPIWFPATMPAMVHPRKHKQHVRTVKYYAQVAQRMQAHLSAEEGGRGAC